MIQKLVVENHQKLSEEKKKVVAGLEKEYDSKTLKLLNEIHARQA